MLYNLKEVHLITTLWMNLSQSTRNKSKWCTIAVTVNGYQYLSLKYQYQYQYPCLKYKYQYQYPCLKYKYKYQYFSSKYQYQYKYPVLQR